MTVVANMFCITESLYLLSPVKHPKLSWYMIVGWGFLRLKPSSKARNDKKLCMHEPCATNFASAVEVAVLCLRRKVLAIEALLYRYKRPMKALLANSLWVQSAALHASSSSNAAWFLNKKSHSSSAFDIMKHVFYCNPVTACRIRFRII